MELILDGKKNLFSLAAGTPPKGHHHWNPGSPRSTTLYSGADFQPTWQLQSPSGPLLSEFGGMLPYLSDAFSLVTPKSFLTFGHYLSMFPFSPHQDLSPGGHTQMRHAWTLSGSHVWLHDTGCDFSIPGFQCIGRNRYPSCRRT